MTRLSSALAWFGLILVASLGLYRTSDRVQQLERQLRATDAAIDAEKQSLHVLNAEWIYFTNPARIEAAAKRHLALRPAAPQQIAGMERLADVLPTRAEAIAAAMAAAAAVHAAPLAATASGPAAQVAVAPAPALSHVNQPKPAAVASSEPGYVRERMVMIQHTASAAPLPGDAIGALINDLNADR